MKIKILHVLYKVDIGGTERAVLNYIREEKSSEVINDALSFYDGYLSDEYKFKTNQFTVINEKNFINKYIFLKKYLKENDYDIVYTYGLRTNIAFRLLPKKYKLIYGIRGLENSTNKLINQLNKLTLNKNDLIITNSNQTKKYIQNKYNVKNTAIEVIHNGTYLPEELSAIDYKDQLQLIIIANLNKVKGYDYLLPAIKQLKDDNINVELKILGEGLERKMIEAYINNHNLTENIKLYGQVEDVYKYLKHSHILVSSSLSEGLSNSIIEGMAMGLPIIATNVGGTSELVIPDETGILIESKNTQQIVTAIKTYYQNPKLMKVHGNNGREIIKKDFTFEKLVEKNNRIFKKII